MTTANMGLNQPAPGTQGPDWANQINANAGLIDTHDHSSGRGVPVTPAGLNINTDLTINTNKIKDVKSVKFINQTATLASSNSLDIYIKNGDLFYANGLTDVQITNGGSVAGASGNISGLASPASATFAGQQFSFFYNAGTYADLRCRDLVLSTNGGNTVKLTHSSTTSYTLTLPPAPPSTSTQMLTVSTGGAVAANTNPTLGDTASVFTWQGTTNSTAVGNGAVVVAGGVSVGQTLRVGNGCRIAGGLSITNFGLGIDAGGATIFGTTAVTGNTTITGTVGVTGSTTITGDLTVTAGITTDNQEIYTRVLEGQITDVSLNVAHGLSAPSRILSVTGLVAASPTAMGGYGMETNQTLLGFGGLYCTDTLVVGYYGNSGSALNKYYRIVITYTKSVG